MILTTLIFVKAGGIVNNTLRPPVPSFCDVDWRQLMEQCWAPDPVARPSFTEIAARLRAMTATKTPAHPQLSKWNLCKDCSPWLNKASLLVIIRKKTTLGFAVSFMYINIMYYWVVYMWVWIRKIQRTVLPICFFIMGWSLIFSLVINL